MGFHFLVCLPCVIPLRGLAATSSSKQFCMLIAVVAEDTETRREHTVNSGASAREVPSEALLVKKLGNPSSRENLVMMSPNERPSSVQTLGEGEGRRSVTAAISGVLISYTS